MLLRRTGPRSVRSSRLAVQTATTAAKQETTTLHRRRPTVASTTRQHRESDRHSHVRRHSQVLLANSRRRCRRARSPPRPMSRTTRCQPRRPDHLVELKATLQADPTRRAPERPPATDRTARHCSTQRRCCVAPHRPHHEATSPGQTRTTFGPTDVRASAQLPGVTRRSRTARTVRPVQAALSSRTRTGPRPAHLRAAQCSSSCRWPVRTRRATRRRRPW